MTELSAFPGLEGVRGRFMALLATRCATIREELRLVLNDRDKAREAFHRIERVLHMIAGSAGTLGMPRLGNRARACEYTISAHLSGDGTTKVQVVDSITAFLEHADKCSAAEG